MYQSLKMIENKDPPTGKPLSQQESLSIKHAAPLQDARVTARRQLEFTTWRAVCRLTQVLRGRGAKRGELRGVSRARAGRGRCPGGGQPLPPNGSPLERRMITRTGAGRCRLMHGGYGHGAGTIAGRLRVFSSIQAVMSLGPKRFGPSDMHLGLARQPTHLLGHAARADFARRRRRRATESDATLAKLARRHRETGREGRHGAKVALQLNGKGTLYFTTT